jgi:hypothetical protein
MTESTTNEIENLRSKLGENPESLVFAPLADALRKAGNLPEALEVCLKGLEVHGHYHNARAVLGRIYQDMGKDAEAEAEFKKVLEADPEHFQALTHVGEILLARKQHQAAIEEFQKALALNPDDEPTQELLKRAIEAAAQEQSKSAAPAPPEKKQVVPPPASKDSSATLTIAELYLKQGHFDKAIEVYQELLAEDPQNLLLRQKLTSAVEQQQKQQATSGGVASKIKKDEFTRPPEPVGDSIAEDAKEAKKVSNAAKARREDDSKFTSEDILQVMLRSDKDDVVEEKPKTIPTPPPSAPPAQEPKASAAPPPAKEVSASQPKAASTQSESAVPVLSEHQTESLKGVLAELAGVEGIRGSFLSSEDGTLLVGLGKADGSGLGQIAAAIFQSTKQSVQRLSQGQMNQVLITADAGQILLVGTAKGVLVVLADDKIKIGLLRLALDAAVKKVEKIFLA